MKIYSHIRDLTGIIDTIYGSTSATPNYTLNTLGKHASHYLGAHGYTNPTITEIEKIWSACTTLDEFTNQLTTLGMAATESHWLWDLIHHDDCGY
jgi:hypothetical protein